MKQIFLFLLVTSLLLGACSRPSDGPVTANQPATEINKPEPVKKPVERKMPENCRNAIIDYMGAIVWNDVTYFTNHESAKDGLERGEKIGEVEFKLDGVACLDYKMQHGDATYAEIGTPIYRVQGYSEQFRLFVGDALFDASINKQAKTIGDLYDIEGKVKKVSFESLVDGSHLFDFTEEASQQFAEEFLKLKYIGSNTGPNGIQYFLRIHLQDGSSLRISYWIDSHYILPGAHDNEVIKGIVRGQINRKKPS